MRWGNLILTRGRAMLLNDRVALGFDSENMLCVGLHLHPKTGDVMVDFFGFYLNANLATAFRPEPPADEACARNS